MSGRRGARQGGWQIFGWPLLMGLANAIGLVAALVGNGWYDLVSWATLGATLIVMALCWRGWSAS